MKKPLTSEQIQQNIRQSQRRNARLMRRLIEILRPVAATDPLLPEICQTLAQIHEGVCPWNDRAIAFEFAQLGLDACLAHPPTSATRLRKARTLVRDYREFLERDT